MPPSPPPPPPPPLPPPPSTTTTSLPTLPTPHPTPSFWHTTHRTPLAQHRSTAHLPARADIVVVGSGITGVFAARELIGGSGGGGEGGVVVLEARDLCSGATGRNGGHVHPLIYSSASSSASPTTTAAATFELANFHSLSDLIHTSQIPCDFFRYPRGGCHAFYSPSAFAEAQAAIAHLRDHAPDLFSELDIVHDRARLAALRIPHAVGAVLQSHAAGLHPYKLVTWLWGQLLESSNLNLQTGTPVTAISPFHNPHSRDRWTVNTPRGTITTPHVLLATNGYTAFLLPDVFGSLIVPVQGEMAALTAPAHMLRSTLAHDYSFMGREMDDYLVQRPAEVGGQFMFGGGRRVAARRGVGVSDDSTCDGKAARYLRGMLGRVLDLGVRGGEEGEGEVAEVEMAVAVPEGWEYEGAQGDGGGGQTELLVEGEWTGIMGYSRDECPWVGGVPGQEGLWICGGYSGHGMPNASLCATHVARLIAAARRGEDWREVEEDAVANEAIPAAYVVTEERMRRARELPEVKGDVPMPEGKL